jgi:HPt (histidine-containing phosphotransfer) domain-containing protein
MESVDHSSTGSLGTRSAGWPVDLLQAIWSEQQPLLEERISVIEQAASALDQGRISEQLSSEAERAAHMLAGSIGIFGFSEASQTARDLETALARPSRKQAQTVRKLLWQLRETSRETLVRGTRG